MTTSAPLRPAQLQACTSSPPFTAGADSAGQDFSRGRHRLPPWCRPDTATIFPRPVGQASHPGHGSQEYPGLSPSLAPSLLHPTRLSSAGNPWGWSWVPVTPPCRSGPWSGGFPKHHLIQGQGHTLECSTTHMWPTVTVWPPRLVIRDQRAALQWLGNGDSRTAGLTWSPWREAGFLAKDGLPRLRTRRGDQALRRSAVKHELPWKSKA